MARGGGEAICEDIQMPPLPGQALGTPSKKLWFLQKHPGKGEKQHNIPPSQERGGLITTPLEGKAHRTQKLAAPFMEAIPEARVSDFPASNL